MALILALVGFDYVGPKLWPDYALFFPPLLLLCLAFVTAFHALFVWRTEWMAAKLFPGQPVPPVRSRDRMLAWISVWLTVGLTVVWIRTLLSP